MSNPKDDTAATKPYLVLARKYRPQHFDELIGQDALVRTLRNAIERNRIAHAFMLTGVRGVGKTTTARIIAKSLNYAGPDGTAGPTTGKTDDCKICKAISEDRHPDVFEMDAASRTGVDDIREILDGVRYAPTSARYKIFIIDEVHMLSKQAFNALLKTLEEPPEHVIFIFATTEVRKVPVTVLSRCQRFDLRRVDPDTLAAHYKSICEKEGVEIDDDALAMIARAADGSVRDGLSLLDQAIVQSDKSITADDIQNMLGLADRGKIVNLFDAAIQGDTTKALSILDDLYVDGADPVILMQDLLDTVHNLTKIKTLEPRNIPNQLNLGKAVWDHSTELVSKLSVPSLGRAWQILLKGLEETQIAPNPQAAVEMTLIKLIYAADLPDPSKLLKHVQDGVNNGSMTAAPNSNGSGMPNGNGGGTYASAAVAKQPAAYTDLEPQTIEDVVDFLEQCGEIRIAEYMREYVRPVKVKTGRLDINLADNAPPDLTNSIGQTLTRLCGSRWMVSVSSEQGQPTLNESKKMEEEATLARIAQTPLVANIMKNFPGAKIISVNPHQNDDKHEDNVIDIKHKKESP